MTTEQKERLDKFFAASLTGLCANSDLRKMSMTGEQFSLGGQETIALMALAFAVESTKVVEKYINVQSSKTTPT